MSTGPSHRKNRSPRYVRLKYRPSSEAERPGQMRPNGSGQHAQHAAEEWHSHSCEYTLGWSLYGPETAPVSYPGKEPLKSVCSVKVVLRNCLCRFVNAGKQRFPCHVKRLQPGWLPRSSLAVLLLHRDTEHPRLALGLEPVALAFDVDGRHEWCNRRSRIAVANTASLKMSPRSTKLLLLVRITEAFS